MFAVHPVRPRSAAVCLWGLMVGAMFAGGGAHAQSTADAFAALEAVFPDRLTATSGDRTIEEGVTLWRFPLDQGSYAYTLDGDTARSAGHIRIDIANTSQWSVLRKALVSGLGKAETHRGNTVLVWEVEEPSAEFANPARIVLTKSGSDAVFSLERRRPVSDPEARISDTVPQKTIGGSNESFRPSPNALKLRDD